MAELNILSPATILAKTKGVALTTATLDVVSAVTTSHVDKVNTILVSNIHASNNGALTLGFYDSSQTVTFNIAKSMTVANKSTLDVLNTPLYLEEGDKLTASADANSTLELVVSYEDMA